MKILSSSQIKEADQRTIANEPVLSIHLMERASRLFCQKFIELFETDIQIHIFCGIGNNGGDGLAISRLLISQGYSVQTYVIGNIQKATPDFTKNYQRLVKMASIQSITHSSNFPAIGIYDIIIDALFGTGLSRFLSDLYKELVVHLNSYQSSIISVDMPSGLFSESHLDETAIAIHATHTISFQSPKLSFFLPQNQKFVGRWYILDLGLDSQFLEGIKSDYYFTLREDIIKLLKPRNRFAHKGNFGRVAIFAGSMGKMGAAVLCVKAAMVAGTGLLTAFVPHCGYEIMQNGAPEAMTISDEDNSSLSQITQDVNSFDAIGVGPGMGQSDEAITALKNLLITFDKPLVIDADALNIISEHTELQELIPAGSVLTPHIKEFERLVGKAKNDFHRLEMLTEASRKWKVVIILKGAFSAISTPEGEIYFNSTGNPGMATAGSGDVLTGLVTSLLGQGYRSREAAILGTYLHGLSGDLCAEEKGEEALIASGIIKFVTKAYKSLTNNE